MPVTYTATSGVAVTTNELVSGPSGTYCDFGNGSSFTAETWIKSTQTTEIFFLTTGTTNSPGWELGMGFGAAGRPHFFVVDDANQGRQNFTAATKTVHDDAWHHVAGVRDSANGSLWIYVDGSLVGSATIASTADGAVSPGAGLRLGKRTSGGTDFIGSLDEVRVSDNARYTGTATISAWGSVEYVNDSNARLLWHFNEGAGSVTVDASSTAANGILSANATWINSAVVSGTSGAIGGVATSSVMQATRFWGPI